MTFDLDSNAGQSATEPATTAQAITATLVPEAERLAFLPEHLFGVRFMLRGEQLVYRWMSTLCPSYSGGFWNYVRLSNGGAYMALDQQGQIRVTVDTNGYEGEMSIEAASIVVNLFALCHLSQHACDDTLTERYYALRDFAAEHAEHAVIFAAID